jgi:hypothetical protein
MEAWTLVGYFLAFLIGMIMGMLGGGGALIVPVMVFLFGKNDIEATAYALFLVGGTATSGMIAKLRKGEVDFSIALSLVIPVACGTFLGRSLIHLLPEGLLFEVFGWGLTRRQLVLTIYACTLLLSFASMMGWWGSNWQARPDAKRQNPRNYWSMVIGLGLVIGMISGLTGAGGGVLIVPVIVVLMGIDMKLAVGTSLTIQVIKSFIGFSKDWSVMGDLIDWPFVLGIMLLMTGGILLGTWVAGFIAGPKLKQGYSWFVLIVAIFILAKELG